jgi:predicted MPP superfamily phosphohydrolase
MTALPKVAPAPPPAGPVRITRRRFVLGACGLVGVPLAATAGYAAGVEPQSLVVTRYALTPPAWPLGRRLTVTVIADLHAGGPNMALGQIRRVVDVANALRSDLVVLLGDYFATHWFVTERVPHPVWAAELARLAAPHGIWAIFGNNDWWYDIDGVRRALADTRIPVLENDAVLLGHSASRFWLAGLGDQIAIKLGRGRFVGVDDLPATLARVTTADPVLLMVHEPDIFTKVPPRVALTLAGHTHGGQIRVPLVWPVFVPSKYGRRFAYGHVVEANRHMIVSGGIGTSRAPRHSHPRPQN